MNRTLTSLLVCLACMLPAAQIAAQRGHCSLVELRVSALTSSGEVPVTSKTPLRKGDKLRLDLRPLRKTYVYVIHVSPRGTATLLYASREQPLLAGTRLVLPATGAYELDAEAGQETILVIASETVLDSASPEHARIVKAVEEEHRVPDEAHLTSQEPQPQPSRPAAPPSAQPQAATLAQPQAVTPAPPPAQGAAPRNARATGVQDLYGDMRGFSDLPTAVAIRAANGVAVASVQLNHVQ